jgi:hypothetical protein
MFPIVFRNVLEMAITRLSYLGGSLNATGQMNLAKGVTQ